MALQKMELLRTSSGLILYADGSTTSGWQQSSTNPPSSFYSDGSNIVILTGSEGYITRLLSGIAAPFIFEARVKWTLDWSKTRIFVWRGSDEKWWNGSRIYDGDDTYRHGWRATDDDWDMNTQAQGYAAGTWYRLRLELISATSAKGYVLADNHTTLKSHGPQTIKSLPSVLKFVIGGGKSNTQYWDWVKVWKNNTVTVTGLPSGWKVELRKTSDDSLVASATESGGTASLDVSALDPDGYPLDGYFKVLNAGDIVQFTSDSFADIWGGDSYEYKYSANNVTFAHSDYSYESVYDDVPHKIKVTNQTEFKIVDIPRNWSYHSITPSSGVTVTCHMDEDCHEVSIVGCTPTTEYTIAFRENILLKPVGWSDDSFTDGWTIESATSSVAFDAAHDVVTVRKDSGTGSARYRKDLDANTAVYKYLVVKVDELSGGASWSVWLVNAETEEAECITGYLTSTGWHIFELDAAKCYNAVKICSQEGTPPYYAKFDYIRFTRALEPFKGPYNYEGRVLINLDPVDDMITAECWDLCNKVGTFTVQVDNSTGLYTGRFRSGDEVEFRGGPLLSLLGWGRVGDVQEKNGVLEITGRNQMGVLLGLEATKTYENKDITAIAKALLADFAKHIVTTHQNDFEEDVDEWTVINGTWSCANGYYSTTVKTETSCETVVDGTDDTQDLVLFCRVKWDNTGASPRTVGIVFHYKAATGYRYYARLCPDYGDAYELYKYDGDWTKVASSGSPGELVNGQWYDMEVRMKGANIQFYVDGDKKIDYTDPSPLTSGRHGLYAHHVATNFDDWVHRTPTPLVCEGKMIDAEKTVDKHIVKHAWLHTEMQKLATLANHLFRTRIRHIGELGVTLDFFPPDYIKPSNGYALDWNSGDIDDYDIADLGRQIYTSVHVRGGLDPDGNVIEALAEDSDSVRDNRVYVRKRLFDSSIKTADAAQKRADAELDKYKQPARVGKLIAFDALEELQVGEVVLVSIPEKDLVNSEFSVIGVRHCLYPYMTELRVMSTGTPISESFADFFGETLQALDEAQSRVVDAELCDVSCQTCSQKTGVCQETCQTNCQGACETSCKGCAQDSCESSCEAGCMACDEIECDTYCMVTCKGECEVSCLTTCELECQESCEASCEGCGQSGHCETSCKDTCQTCSETPCMDKCETSCQMTCEETCEAWCENYCQTCEEGGSIVRYRPGPA